jgi:hypothetical protein
MIPNPRLAILALLAFQTPAPLAEADFFIADLHPGSPAALVRRNLGSPDSTRVGPSEEGDCYEHQFFKGLTVNLIHGAVYNFEVTDTAKATVRGLRVGDPLSRARSLYGAPTLTSPHWEYAKRDDEEFRLMLETTSDARVRAIYVGEFPNCD